MKILISILLAAGASVAFAQPNYCMQETVVGTYAVMAQGTVILPTTGGQTIAAPWANLGIAAIDLEGAISANAYSSMGGQVSQSPMSGVIKVRPDCTGTVEWTGMGTATILIMDEGRTLRSQILTAGGLAGGVVYGDWKRISRIPNTVAPVQCAPGSMSGVYEFEGWGTVMMTPAGASQPVPVPLKMIGMGSAAYDGATVAHGTGSMGGQMVPLTISAVNKVKVNPDCTATLLWNVSSRGQSMGLSEHFAVILDGGNEIWGLEKVDPSGLPVMLATWTRISPIPAAR